MLKLKSNTNIIEKLITIFKKYFRFCFSKKITKKIKSKNNIKGNLFPDKIMPDKIIKKSRRLISKEYFFGKFLKKRGIVKKANKENLCK